MMKILDFKKKVGFILTSVALGLYLLGLIGYIIFSSNAGKMYADGGIIAFNIIFLVLCALLTFIKYTEKYVPILLALAILISLLSFVSSSYMYFSVIFYDKFDIALLFTNDIGYPLAFLSYFIGFIVSSVSIFFKQGENQFEVKEVNNSKPAKAFKISKTVTMAISTVATFAFAVILVATPILNDNATAITSALGEKTYIDVIYDDGLEEDSEYFTSDKVTVRQMKEYTGKIIQEAVEEGAVLLKNNGVLPLGTNKTVSFFSSSSVDLVNGCGSSQNTDVKATLKEGAEHAGLQVNETLWNWYLTNTTYRRSYGGKDQFTRLFYLNDASWDEITTESKTDGDVAILVISRDAGEGIDPNYYGGNPTSNFNGNYLQLSNKERDVLNHLNTTFPGKVVVLLNCANEVQIDFEADAILWIGNVGTTGAYGVMNLIAGQNDNLQPLSPSGHASDTFWKEHRFNPVLANFEHYNASTQKFEGTSYTNRVVPSESEVNEYAPKTTNDMILSSNNYMVYQEGIYNGYRYVETRYEDVVLGKANAGDFNYSDVVAYPFGYGASYTTFSYSDLAVHKNGSGNKTSYVINVTVTNTGSFKGKGVAQIYLQKPYATYDVTNHIEKASVELVGFNKTRTLEPGESQILQIYVSEELFASYDAYGAGTYILQEGTHYLTVASDAHNAVNNILMKKDIDAISQSRMVGSGDASLVEALEYEFDDSKYSKSVETDVDIVNQFNDVDMNLYEGKGNNVVDYVSRNNWNDTVKLGVDTDGSKLNNETILTGTPEMIEDMKNPTIEQDDVAYPTYGSGASNYRLIDAFINNWEYDDERWESLLDQMTWDETVKLLSDATRSTQPINSVSKRATLDFNGAIGPLNYNYKGNGVTGLAYRNNDPDQNTNTNAYVCNGLLAATFSEEFIHRYGKAMGEDCLWCGYNGLYGPGVNIHRSAFGGRAFEYYSEDPILTGKIAAAQIRGIQYYGVYCYVKHAICNDSEVMREGINIWANEQTIREIYLRPFELCIREGGAPNVMSGFNRLGLKWNGHQGFLKNVLHEEFGMKGFAVSDWYDERTWYMTSYYGLLNGNDVPDGSYSSTKNSACLLNNYRTGYGRVAHAMRDAVHRMLYIIANSNVMNGLASNVDTFIIVPRWIRNYKKIRKAVTATFIVSLALTVTSVAGYYTLNLLKAKKERVQNEK